MTTDDERVVSDLASKHRTEPIPPQPHRLVADIDAALGQEVFYVAQAERVPDLEQDRCTDHLGR